MPSILAIHLSTTTQEYKLNSAGAIQHPCLNPLPTSISSSGVSPRRIWAFMSWWKDCMISTGWSGTPNFFRTTHIASLGTESYAFLRLMKTRKALVLCSQHFSTSCRTVKIMSEQPHILFKSHTGIQVALQPSLALPHLLSAPPQLCLETTHFWWPLLLGEEVCVL